MVTLNKELASCNVSPEINPEALSEESWLRAKKAASLLKKAMLPKAGVKKDP